MRIKKIESSLFATGLSIREICNIISDKNDQYIIPKVLSPKYSKRYEIWNSYLNNKKEPIVIIIAGIPATGKSTLAIELGSRLGLGVIGGDALREFLRGFEQELIEKNPFLFDSVFNAWKHIASNNIHSSNEVDLILKGYIAQSKIINRGMESLLKRCVFKEDKNYRGESYIIEYLHFLPNQIDNAILSIKNVIPIVLVLDDLELHKKRIISRSIDQHIGDDPNRLLKVIDKYRIMQDEMVKQAKKANIPVIDNVDYKETLEKTLDIIYSAINKLIIKT